MPSEVKIITQGIKTLKKILNQSSDLLKDAADQMYKFSKSLKKVEKDFANLKVLKVKKISSSEKNLPLKEQNIEKIKIKKKAPKIGPPQKIEQKKPPLLYNNEKSPSFHPDIPRKTLPVPPIAPKKINQESITKKKFNNSHEKESLVSVKKKISELLDRLKEEIIEGTDFDSISSKQKISQERESLDGLKDDMSKLYNRFKNLIEEDDFYNMTSEQKNKALKDMAEAIKILTDEYNK
ncbi:MAG: hypothetical protein ACFFAN_13810 [Promethearchaeota archaeon]